MASKLVLPGLDPVSLRTSMVDLFITAATTTWVVYDYFLTMADEIGSMWDCQFSIVTLLVLLFRYGALLRQVLLMCQFLHMDFTVHNYVLCNVSIHVLAGVDVIMYTAIIALMFLCTDAVSVGRKGIKAFSVLVFGMVFVGCDAYFRISNFGVRLPAQPPYSGCVLSQPIDKRQAKINTIVSSIGLGCVLVCELLAQYFTWERSFGVKNATSTEGRRPVFSVLLRDGTLCYLLVTVWSIMTEVFIDIRDSTLSGIAIIVYRIIFQVRSSQVAQSTKRVSVVKVPPSQMIDTTNLDLYLSEAEDEDAIPGEYSRFSIGSSV